MNYKRISLVVWLVLFLVGSACAQTWPTKGWQTATPKAVGLIGDTLAVLDRELASGKYGYIDGMLVIRHGKVVYEKSYPHDYASIYKQESKEKGALNSGDPGGPYNYYNPWWHPFYHGTQLHSMQSVTKTITSVIIGAAIARNDFPDINTPVLKFFDASTVKNVDSRKQSMTVLHLLTMTGGFDWNEGLPYSDPNNTCSIMEASSNWVQYAIDRPMSDEPGKVFNYNSGGTEILAHIFRVATGVDIEEYAVKYLFGPLGIKDFYWKRTPSGLVDSEGGLYLSQRDLAKIFYLYLKNGKWDDKQIVSSEWVTQSVTPFINVVSNVSYGYKWWLSPYPNDKSKMVWRGSGFGGQSPIVIPDYDMVIVITAWNIVPGKGYSTNFVLNKVLHSIKDFDKLQK